MKHWPWFIFVIACSACDDEPNEHQREAAWVEHRPVVAQHFTVLSKGDLRRLIVFGAGGRGDTIADNIVANASAASCDECLSTQRVAVLSTTYLPYISTLGVAERVVGAVHLDHVRDIEMKKRIAKGEVTDIGTADGVDREAIIALAPDLVLGYPFGRTSGEEDIVGVPLVLVTEYLEPHPLGRAEWLKFFGVLFAEERAADSLYAGIAQRYADAKASAATTDKPKVLFGSQWNGQWWVPPGNSYMAQLIADAGGDYVFADLQGKENIAVDMETILARARDADAWGMIAELPKPAGIDDFTGGDERLEGLKAVREKFLFLGNTARSDLFGQALVEPDVVLRNLRELFDMHAVYDHPDSHVPRYFGHALHLAEPPVRIIDTVQ